MATKKELTQAQSYSRRRLTTAFVSGIPGGKELEPSKPMRAVVAGVALSVLLVLGSLAFGLINPALPDGWEDNSLILVEGSGSRYVSIKGTLYPVINTTSARLIIPAGAFKVISVDEDKITDVPRGETIGIHGAPDTLPDPQSLAGNSWSACLTPPTSPEGPSGVSAVLNPNQVFALDTMGAMIVSVNSDPFLIAGGKRYEIEPGGKNGILRAMGLSAEATVPVTAQWLELFPAGTALRDLQIDGLDSEPPNPIQIDGSPLLVGSIIHIKGSPDDDRLVVTSDGSLAELSPFAYPFYLLGSGDGKSPIDVAPSQVGPLDDAKRNPAPSDWPTKTLQALPDGESACALLTARPDGTAVTSLAIARPFAPNMSYPFRSESGSILPGAYVTPGSGALIRAMATGDGPVKDGISMNYDLDHGNAFLIDQTGTLFPMPQADEDTLARLGYTVNNLMTVPQEWTALFPVGAALTLEAAQRPPLTEPPPDDA